MVKKYGSKNIKLLNSIPAICFTSNNNNYGGYIIHNGSIIGYDSYLTNKK